jgi:hypothetical protein
MLGRLRSLSTLLALIALSSCQRSAPRIIKDTEGRRFEATCPKGEPCRFVQKSGPQRADKPAQTLLVGGRLVGICDVASGSAAPDGAFDCRPLGCDSDADCPPLHDMKDGQCLHGRCSDPAEALGVQDAILLCLAGTGLGRETPAQIERYALALNCGSPCTVPAPCEKL